MTTLEKKKKRAKTKKNTEPMKDQLKNKFKEQITELLRQQDTSGSAMAKKCGITPSGFNYYLSGERCPDAQALYKICTTFNISADWLLGLSPFQTRDATIAAACETTGLSEDSISILAETKQFFEEHSNPTSINTTAITIDWLLKNIKFIDLMFHYLYDEHKSLLILNDDHKLGDKPIAIVCAEKVSEYTLSDFEGLARIKLLDALTEFRKSLEPERQNIHEQLQLANAEYLLPGTDEEKEEKAEWVNRITQGSSKKGENTDGNS